MNRNKTIFSKENRKNEVRNKLNQIQGYFKSLKIYRCPKCGKEISSQVDVNVSCVDCLCDYELVKVGF